MFIVVKQFPRVPRAPQSVQLEKKSTSFRSKYYLPAKICSSSEKNHNWRKYRKEFPFIVVCIASKRFVCTGLIPRIFVWLLFPYEYWLNLNYPFISFSASFFLFSHKRLRYAATFIILLKPE